MVTALDAKLAAFFAGAPGEAVAVYLFGSVARGDEDDTSDVDVAVLFNEPPNGTLTGGRLSLEGELERHLRRPDHDRSGAGSEEARADRTRRPDTVRRSYPRRHGQGPVTVSRL